MSDLTEAIGDHRAAWQAFQDAPAGKQAQMAEDAECAALTALLAKIPADWDDLVALVDHLGWYTAEEHERRGQSDCGDAPFALLATLELAMGGKP